MEELNTQIEAEKNLGKNFGESSIGAYLEKNFGESSISLAIQAAPEYLGENLGESSISPDGQNNRRSLDSASRQERKVNLKEDMMTFGREMK